jgi:hypothetical protein
LDSKEKNFYIHSDIGVGLGSEIKFKSRDLDFNEFLILKRFRPSLNRKFGILIEGFKIQTNSSNPRQGFEFQDKEDIV